MNFIKNDTQEFYQTVAEPANKIAVTTKASVLSQVHNNHYYYYRSGVSSLLILKENVETLFHGIFFSGFNPFYDSFMNLTGGLADGGFFNYWDDMTINPKGFKMKIEEIGPQVLTMEHLMICFKICLGSSIICTIVFVAEVGIEIFIKVSAKKTKATFKTSCLKMMH